jgi:succinate dehydrogenase flavin-adding protein (antitoxin of CptAB toxin-antitoxin module)
MPRQEYISEPDIKRQLDTVMQQYQQLQQSKQSEPASQKYLIGDFDKLLKELDPDVAEVIANDQEFAHLNAIIQQDIQAEIMSTIKWRLNSNSNVTQRVKRAIDIVTYYQQNKVNEDKKNISELNDYIQNYSDMTFNEYKKMKGTL